ncbi:hypothetical protein BEH94_08410 [Candidatus Altiarchaeales archaeon WOR_SM1_SCG]|nr:hypothetical protein BEH94_08410 [Candidatus Altiarchaeales archaeon WOR_SM1_SCG]
MVTLQKEVIGKDVTKETIVQIQKDVKRGKRYASLRLWTGSAAFTGGIMALVVGGLYIEEDPMIWWISGFLGALLIMIGFHYISSC